MPSSHGHTPMLEDGPAVRAEFVFLSVALTMVLLLGLAGVPATAERLAGDGSDALRQGWLAQHQAQALAAGSEPGSRLDESAGAAQR